MDCYLEFKDVSLVFMDMSRLISAQKLSVGFRSGRLAQCTDVMLCLPFLDNSNSVEESNCPHSLADGLKRPTNNI